MNALADNPFTQGLAQLAKDVPRPKAILVVSAHWLTAGTFITHMQQPKTIHDFYGFPQALFDIQYPAPGNPELAERISRLIEKPRVQLDKTWGLDHGTWSILHHMYPAADIPVLQLSIDMAETPAFHFELGKKLRELRHEGILILGSGNIVHNLRQIRWDQPDSAHSWAVEFDEDVKRLLLSREFKPLLGDALMSTAGKLSVPTPDHYYPLLYVLGASESSDLLTFPIEGFELGSISLRSLNFNKPN